jgi:tetratricopeptide (TPR) repeat protein
MAEARSKHGLRFAWSYYDQDLHGTVPLVSMRDGLLFLFDWWELKSPYLYNNPATPTDTLVALVRARSERLKKNLGYPVAMEEALLNMLGNMAMSYGQQEKALAFFELAVAYYPESAAAHDAMVDYFVSQQDSVRALAYARKALALDRTSAREARVSALSSER